MSFISNCKIREIFLTIKIPLLRGLNVKMCIKNVEKEEEMQKNALKASIYLYDAILSGDYESAKLELQELQFQIKYIEDMKVKRERLQMLTDMVTDMKARGINIDFAKRDTFLKTNAKNAVEKHQKSAFFHEIDKKRQQA